MNKYKELKEKARQEAIEWQQKCGDIDYSYGELAEFQQYFENKAKKYGLIREFRENGIV